MRLPRVPATGYHVQMPVHSLICHPSTPSKVVRRVAVRVRRTCGQLVLVYWIEGDLNSVHWPSPRSSRRTDQLWWHTCCELFLRERGQTDYYEFNFSPSTEWAIYRFSAYRKNMAVVEDAKQSRIAPRVRTDRFELATLIDLKSLSPRLAITDLHLAVSVVVEQTDGQCSYWALRHPSGRPDFHHPDSFALMLDRTVPVSTARQQDPIDNRVG